MRSYLRYKSGLIATMAGLVSIEDNSMTVRVTVTSQINAMIQCLGYEINVDIPLY